MNIDAPKQTSAEEGWDKFWQGSKDAAFSAAGLHHPIIAAFWKKYFARMAELYNAPRVLDIASGSGAVVDQVLHAFGDATPPITCVDVSQAAVDRLSNKYRNVTGIAVGAESIPLPDGQFDIATSQFGIEYAGAAAIAEACRLVKAKGHIAFVVHHRDGAIYTDCSNNLAAIERVQNARFVPLAIDLFETGFRAVAGGDRAPYDAAGSALSPAVKAVETVLNNYGGEVADGTIAKLYNDIGQIHSNMPQYQPEEVAVWLRHTDEELKAYAARMRSMCESAMSEQAFDALCENVSSAGFNIELSLALSVSTNQPPLAWVLVANRGEAVLGEMLQSATQELEKIEAWNQEQIETAVKTVTETNSYDSPVLEARMKWSVPMKVAVCQVREMGSDGHFYWTISGECPNDAIPFQAATTPIEAARHFAMQWQLKAAQTDDDELASTAEEVSKHAGLRSG